MNIVDILIKRGNELFEKPYQPLEFTKDKDIDSFLNNLDEYPHLYVLACIMDRQVKAERAWAIPYRISKEINSFQFDDLVKIPLERIKNIFTERKLHRFNEKMAICYYEAIIRIRDQYKGDVSLIWKGVPGSATIVKRFLQFHGAGIKIATMATNILAREFKIPMKDRICIDISPDVQVKRVFQRLGFISENTSTDEIIFTARELNPEYPGIFDHSCWELGRTWCKPQNPVCDKCYLDQQCPKIMFKSPADPSENK
jgi:endonuclease-3